MAYTQQQLDALKAAIADGALVVKYGDKSTQYRSLDEMIRIKEMMEDELGINVNATGGIVYPTFGKGLE